MKIKRLGTIKMKQRDQNENSAQKIMAANGLFTASDVLLFYMFKTIIPWNSPIKHLLQSFAHSHPFHNSYLNL